MGSFAYLPPAPFDLDQARLAGRLVGAAYDMVSQWEAQGSPKEESAFSWTPQGPDLSYSAVGPRSSSRPSVIISESVWRP